MFLNEPSGPLSSSLTWDYTGLHRRGASTAVSGSFCLAARKWVKDKPEIRMSPTSSDVGALPGGVCKLGFVGQNEGWDG
jgi:hypothetical protein